MFNVAGVTEPRTQAASEAFVNGLTVRAWATKHVKQLVPCKWGNASWFCRGDVAFCEEHGRRMANGCRTTTSDNLEIMNLAVIAGVNIAFVVVFSIFVIATLALLVLTIQFIVARGKADKRKFEEQRSSAAGDESPPS